METTVKHIPKGLFTLNNPYYTTHFIGFGFEPIPHVDNDINSFSIAYCIDQQNGIEGGDFLLNDYNVSISMKSDSICQWRLVQLAVMSDAGPQARVRYPPMSHLSWGKNKSTRPLTQLTQQDSLIQLTQQDPLTQLTQQDPLTQLTQQDPPTKPITVGASGNAVH